MKILIILSDNIGSIVNIALLIGLLFAIITGFLTFKLVKTKRGTKILAAIVMALLLFFLAMKGVFYYLGNA